MKKKINEFMNERIIPLAMKFIELKAVVALKEGILFTLPLLIIGSLFLLVANFPYEPIVEFIETMGWGTLFEQVNGATFQIISLIAVIGVAYSYAKNEDVEPLAAGVISFSVYLITIHHFVESETGETVAGVIPKEWTAGQGMIAAIIIGLIVGSVYTSFIKKGITIKMPKGVPSGVASSFSALIPGGVLILGSSIIFQLFDSILETTFVEFIYDVIQTPLTGLTDSLWGIIMYATIATIFWWFGVHGGSIVTGIYLPILLANIDANQAIVDSGQALTIENGAHIVTDQFTAVFVNMTGTGVTLGLVLYMVFFAKSKQYKDLGKLSLVPSLFNINEPVIFGTPIVLNPFLLIPFVLTPTVVGTLMYGAIYFGLVPPFSGVIVPWTTPAVVSGFLLGGWRMAFAQIIILLISFGMYFPFVRKADRMNLENEQDEETQNVL